MLPDMPDSDDIVIYLVLERVKTERGAGGFIALDITKKSEL